MPSIANIQTVMSLTASKRLLIDAVSKLFKLLIILPATNATSERSLSALRRIKSYLRNTMFKLSEFSNSFDLAPLAGAAEANYC